MDDLWQRVAADFQDLPDIAEAIRSSIRLLTSAAGIWLTAAVGVAAA